MQESEKRLNTKVLTVHEPVHNLSQSEQVAKLPESKLMACRNDLANSRISRFYVQANYEADKTIQKVIKLVKERNATVVSRLPPPWREKFNAFSIDIQVVVFLQFKICICMYNDMVLLSTGFHDTCITIWCYFPQSF